MTSKPNPYSPPVAEEASQRIESQPEQGTLDFLPIMRRWERFRVIYNVALIGFTILMTLVFTPANVVDIDFWVIVCIGGVVSNLCFLIGPAIEAYGTRFRLWRPVMTPLLFVAGLLGTAVLAGIAILEYPAFI